MFRGIIDTPQGEGRRIQIAVFILPYYLNEWRFNSAPRHIIFFYKYDYLGNVYCHGDSRGNSIHQ